MDFICEFDSLCLDSHNIIIRFSLTAPPPLSFTRLIAFFLSIQLQQLERIKSNTLKIQNWNTILNAICWITVNRMKEYKNGQKFIECSCGYRSASVVKSTIRPQNSNSTLSQYTSLDLLYPPPHRHHTSLTHSSGVVADPHHFKICKTRFTPAKIEIMDLLLFIL